MGYYVTPTNEYYEGDQVRPLDRNVPRRPDHTYEWNGADWVQDPAKVKEIHNPSIIAQIKEIEIKQFRSLKEFVLDPTNQAAKTKLDEYESQIVSLRSQLMK